MAYSTSTHHRFRIQERGERETGRRRLGLLRLTSSMDSLPSPLSSKLDISACASASLMVEPFVSTLPPCMSNSRSSAASMNPSDQVRTRERHIGRSFKLAMILHFQLVPLVRHVTRCVAAYRGFCRTGGRPSSVSRIAGAPRRPIPNPCLQQSSWQSLEKEVSGLRRSPVGRKNTGISSVPTKLLATRRVRERKGEVPPLAPVSLLGTRKEVEAVHSDARPPSTQYLPAPAVTHAKKHVESK